MLFTSQWASSNSSHSLTRSTRGIPTLIISLIATLIATSIMVSAHPASAVSGPANSSKSEPVLQARSGSSTVGVDWHRETPASLNGFAGSGIAYGNGYFVAVTSTTNVPGSKVARSTDGRNWVVAPDVYGNTSTASWRGIAFGGGVFVAVASGGQIMTSTDGLTWTARTPIDGGEAWSGISYGNGTFVAIAPNGYARYSTNGGATWTRSSLQAIFTSISALAFGNDIFVAVGISASYTSSDGITWATSDNIATKTGGYHYGGLAFGAGKWIALPSDNRLPSSVQGSLYSTDGLTWTAVNPLSNVPGKCFNAVTFGAGLFVAFSCNAVTPAAIISPDGTAWTSVITGYPGTPPESPLPAVAYGDGMFVSTAYVQVYTSQPTPAITGISPSSGPTPGGRTVTINGTALQNTTAVTFNGVAATSFANVSSTQITAVVPAGTAGTATVDVTTWGGSTTSTAFTYIAPPVITSLSPTNAPTTGGRTIVVSGANLGNTTSVTVDGVAATGIVNTSGTEIRFVSPAGSAGSKSVVLTTEGGGSVSLADGLTLVVPPTIASLSPALGFDSGGTSVTLTGTNLSNTTSVSVGGAAATSVTNVSGTEITFTTPSGTIGTSDVVVTTSGGGPTTSSGGYRYIGQPTITGVAPAGGPIAGSTSVVITGANLTNTTSVTIGGVASTITGNTSTSVTVTTPASSAGDKSIVLQTYDGVGSVTSANAFTYVSPPTITSLSRSVATIDGGQIVVVTGTNLSDTSSVTLGSTSVASLVNVSATSVQFVVPVGTVGLRDLTLTTTYGGSVTSVDAFRYIGSPTVTSITPDIGPTTGGTSVTIVGANLSNVTQVNIGGFIGTVTANTDTSLTFTSGVATSSGSKSVTIQTYSGAGTAIVSNGFTYVTPPTITSVSPALGLESGGTSVTISGVNLLNASSVTFGGVAGTVTANTGTAITVTTPAVTPGATNVVVTTTGGGSVTSTGAFTFVGQPSISEISPDAGPATGGLAITITGTNLGNVTTVSFGGNAGSITSNSSTAITVIPPASASGTVDVTVDTHGGVGSVTSNSAYTYITPPTLTSISPTSGVAGTVITLIGTNLNPTTAVTVGSQSATFSVVSDTEVLVTAPGSLTGSRVIALTSPGGSVIASQLFSFPDPPAPDTGGTTSESSPSSTVTAPLQGDLGPMPPVTTLQPGQDLVMVGGQRIPVSSSANPANNGLSLRGEGWGLSLETLSPTGRPTALGSNGTLLLVAGGSLPIGGSGYAPGTDATVYLMSTPQLLGVLPVNAQGMLQGTLTLPTGMPPGNHTLQVNGLNPDGAVRSISLGVTATEPTQRTQRIGTRVLFDLGSAELTRRAKQSLKALVAQISDKSRAVTLVSAGLRNSGATESDRKLARQRGENVESYLKDQGLRGPITIKTRKITVSQRPQDRNVVVSVEWKAAE